MARVISLDRYRERRHPGAAAVTRLDVAVGRLDALVRAGTDLSPTIERELRSIARSVAAGHARRAADRAERLADILEHPAASTGPR
jgi:hypothetical protein